MLLKDSCFQPDSANLNRVQIQPGSDYQQWLLIRPNLFISNKLQLIFLSMNRGKNAFRGTPTGFKLNPVGTLLLGGEKIRLRLRLPGERPERFEG